MSKVLEVLPKQKLSIRVTAAIVDEIMDFKPQEAGRFEQITQLSVNALNKKPEFKGITKHNFSAGPWC